MTIRRTIPMKPHGKRRGRIAQDIADYAAAHAPLHGVHTVEMKPDVVVRGSIMNDRQLELYERGMREHVARGREHARLEGRLRRED